MEHKSEIKFIEWAKTIKTTDLDVRTVTDILKSLRKEKLVGIDVGGGMGQFAAALCENVQGCEITVVDKSSLVAPSFVNHSNCKLVEADWLMYKSERKFDFVIFKTVLHHFVKSSERETKEAQLLGLLKAADVLKEDGVLIVVEVFYESVFESLDWSGRLIYEITKMAFIEKITRNLGANTAGEGVRFRGIKAWTEIFNEAGFEVEATIKKQWSWQTWQRILLLGKDRYQAVLKLQRSS